MFQSAYRANHSTETALLKVQNDILCTMDRKEIVILTLLDMSAAFDLVDHEILLQRMHTRIGVTGTALDWFRSYLSGRYQFVKIKDSSSKYESVPCGVPLLFTIFTLPLGDIFRRHGISYHPNADDTQIYITSKTDSQEFLRKLENCILDIHHWMQDNLLKLHDSKTKILILGSAGQLMKHQITKVKVEARM